LAQGDILLPTEALHSALEVPHRWFTDRKYLGFVVISQTCDLVRRGRGLCKTPYIEIAVVRPFRAYILTLLKRQCEWIGDRYFPSTAREKANDLIDRIINQNEAALGICYLHPEASIGIAEGSIALLRVSIAMRADEHYDTLIAARKGRLHPEFANKLGWLCGNLYSRVGIKDWNETEEDQKIAIKIKKAMLDDTDGRGPRFVDCPREFLKDMRNGNLNLQNGSEADIESKLKEYASKSYKQSALDAISGVLERQRVDPAVRTKILGILNSNSDFIKTLRPGSP
jgi:hypothetical protein